MESKSKECDVSNIEFDQLNLSESQDHVCCLPELPEDVLFTILLYIGPKDVDESVKLVNRSLHNATSLSRQLWKEFCILTGKALDKQYENTKGIPPALPTTALSGGLDEESDELKEEINPFRFFYHRNPCVPIDFETIAQALAHCPRTPIMVLKKLDEAEFMYSPTGTICLMPGVYKERIVIKGEEWGVGSTVNNNKAISIRASFPKDGATIMHYIESDDAKNQPCISVSTRDTETLEGVQKGITVKLSHLVILHCTRGSDLWGGNSAVVADGARAQVIIDKCVIQSHSGRGIVITNQAELQMTASSVLDCAATGFYLGDWGSRAHVSGCNIVRNGYGSRKSLVSAEGRQELDNVLTEWTRLRANANGVTVEREQFDVVPPGHSGIYIEGAMCWIDSTLIASNCLTGTSVVRNGFLSLSGCDISSNAGSGHPILIEEEHDIGNNRLQGARIRGGVVEGPRQNCYSNSPLEKLRDGAAFSYDLVRGPMSEEELLNLLDAV